MNGIFYDEFKERFLLLVNDARSEIDPNPQMRLISKYPPMFN